MGLISGTGSFFSGEPVVLLAGTRSAKSLCGARSVTLGPGVMSFACKALVTGTLPTPATMGSPLLHSPPPVLVPRHLCLSPPQAVTASSTPLSFPSFHLGPRHQGFQPRLAAQGLEPQISHLTSPGPQTPPVPNGAHHTATTSRGGAQRKVPPSGHSE